VPTYRAMIPSGWPMTTVGLGTRSTPITGTLKQRIGQSAFESAARFGSGSAAGTDRTRDFESMAYDEAHHVLYVFSGPCCSSSVLPTAFRLTRGTGGVFRVESYQPLASGTTAAGWNSADGKLYVGVGRRLRSYTYVTNIAGPIFRVPTLSGITGMYLFLRRRRPVRHDERGDAPSCQLGGQDARRWLDLRPHAVRCQRQPSGGADQRSVLRARWLRRTPERRSAQARRVRLRRAPLTS
jgi:hypothetical protein